MKNAYIIAALYLIFGISWIYASDFLLFSIWEKELDTIHRIQNLKGYAFTLISSLVIFFLVTRFYKNLINSRKEVVTEKNFLNGILNSISANMAVINGSGDIINVNQSWEKFALENSNGIPLHTGIGTNYLEVCQKSFQAGDEIAGDIAKEINSVISNQKSYYSMEYPCHSEDMQRWFKMSVSPLNIQQKGVVIIHEDITARKLAELELKNQNEFLASVLKEKSETEAQLKKSNDLYQQAEKVAQIGYWERDLVRNNSIWSEGVFEIFGLNSSENTASFQLLMSMVHPEDKELLSQAIEHSTFSGNIDVSFRIIKPDKSIGFYNGKGKVVKNKVGNASLTGIIQDITGRKLAEQQLQKSEQKYRNLFGNTPVPTMIIEKNTLKFLEVNRAALIKYEFSKEEFLSMTFKDINKNIKVETIEINSDSASDIFTDQVVQHQTKKGQTFYVYLLSSAIEYEGKQCELISVNDINDQIDTEKQITNAIIQAIEQERSSIAQEIHDSLTQTLSIVSLNLKNLLYDFPNLNNQPKYEKASYFLDEAIDQSRSLSHQIMPSTIVDFGLVPSIQELIEDYDSQIEINFNHQGENVQDKDKSLQIYRITQETLRNAIKHSGADKIKINLLIRPESISLEILDNGKGFNYQDRMIKEGIGLRIMRSRAIQMNGNLKISSDKNIGTKITLQVPL